MFTSIFTVRNTKTKFEIKCFEKSISKKMTFDHPKIVNWFLTNHKFNTAKTKIVNKSAPQNKVFN